MNRIHVSIATGLAALALAAAGCGGDDDEDSGDNTQAATPTETTPPPKESGGATTSLELSADPSGQLKFDKSELEGKAGNVTITMQNPSEVPHAVGIEGNGVDEEGETVTKGGTSTVSAELKPGNYEFYCPVPGHEEGGMKGTLTVK